MRKPFLFFIAIIFSFFSKAGTHIWASAVCLNVNGTASFYNTLLPEPSYAIGNIAFGDRLGVFGKNSGNLKITGAEINLSSTANSCTAKMFYFIYRDGERPEDPVFSAFMLQPYCKCMHGAFAGCGGKQCDNVNDQKLQTVNQDIDLTQLETGNYIIELYFIAAAGNDLTEKDIDNNGSANYKAMFTVTAPLSVNFLSLYGFAADDDIRIRWSVANDIDITRYEVEKSANGLSFVPLQTIGSSQNPNGGDYFYRDTGPFIGANYYRIKSYNTNGAVTISRVFRIYYGKVGNTVLIYPNPVGTELNMWFAGIKQSEYKMSVLGTNGQLITTRTLYYDGVDKIVKITLPPGLQRGIYWLFLIDKYQFYKQSFMVK